MTGEPRYPEGSTPAQQNSIDAFKVQQLARNAVNGVRDSKKELEYLSKQPRISDIEISEFRDELDKFDARKEGEV